VIVHDDTFGKNKEIIRRLGVRESWQVVIPHDSMSSLTGIASPGEKNPALSLTIGARQA
jgi:hypothetical protein